MRVFNKGGIMEKYKTLVIILVLLLFVSCAKDIQKTPQSVVYSFIENVKKLNAPSPTTINQAKKILSKLFSTEKAYEAFTTTFRNIEIKEYKIGKVSIEGTTASLPVKMTTKGLIGLSKEEVKVYTFSLLNKNGSWYISDIAGILEHFEKKPVEKGKEVKDTTSTGG